jgi:hypothetical protein
MVQIFTAEFLFEKRKQSGMNNGVATLSDDIRARASPHSLPVNCKQFV